MSKINDEAGAGLYFSSGQRLTIRLHVSANFLRIASRPSVARYARDVLSRDVPRETGCSRSAQYRILPNMCGIGSLSLEL